MIEPEVIKPSAEINWERVREDFPATKRLAYLNSAAAGPVPRAVAEAAAQFYRDTLESGDERWFEWLEERELARRNIAQLINAEPDEIGFTINTSTGMNLIVDALEGRGDVISCDLEFPVSTIPWMHRGQRVHLVKAVDGVLPTEDVIEARRENTGIICLSHVQYSNGFRADLEELGKNKGEHALVVNAAQSVGVFPVDVKRMRIDALCSTGHKWMLGGYGSGFVYLSRELLATTRTRAISWLSVHDPFRMLNSEYVARSDAGARAEMGCPHFAGIFALGSAARYILKIGAAPIEQRALTLNRHLTTRLIAAGWKVLSPLANEASRSAETLIEVERPHYVVKHLAERGVAVTIKREGIRVATHFFNNEDDIERLIAALEQTRDM